MGNINKTNQAKDINNVVLGIGGALGHDSNAALIVEGKLIAASQEERFSRIKHDGKFPISSILNCLEIADLTPADVRVCVFAEKPIQRYLFRKSQRSSSWLSKVIGHIAPKSWHDKYTIAARKLLPNANFHYAWHHFSHAAAAFHSSPFENAAFLCLDGVGEDVSASIGRINHHELEVIYEQPYENGLGIFYFLVTKFLGFDSWGAEYKVMGLSSYGTPRYVNHLRSLFTEGTFGGIQLRSNLYFDVNCLNKAKDYVAEATSVPARKPGEPLNNNHIDIAASLQILFEQEVMKMSEFAHKITGEQNLLFCGGCAQNCVAAGTLINDSPFKEVFTSPVGGDMGNSLGASLLYERLRRKNDQPIQIATNGYYLGSFPGSIPDEAKNYCLDLNCSLHEYVAQILSEGKIVGWVRGRMELGARALGARSILADPRPTNMQSVLNLKIKYRESFRPFAPAILAEHAEKWFELNYPSNYMQYTAKLKPELRYSQPEHFDSFIERLNYKKCAVPSIVHVDYSARLQTVDSNIHPDFHKLINAFYKITGVPLIINTSFNVSNQPIVRTAKEAWECFVNTDIDFLVINDCILKNPFLKSQEEKKLWAKKFKKYF